MRSVAAKFADRVIAPLVPGSAAFGSNKVVCEIISCVRGPINFGPIFVPLVGKRLLLE